jgi:UDP-N-acetylglucosamine--N-acetylmuramyl-(pentapeptide) pyrophosphoryl-undecaprenol N-acetylglucosamine transferase
MNLKMKKKVLIAAGGTGGHLFPAQQLAEMLKEDSQILFAGHKIGTTPFFEKEKIPFAEIAAHPLKKGFLGALWRGFWQSFQLIRQFAPDVVVGFGSYHAFPVLLAAALFRKKLVLFEANSLLGKVNRFFRPVASHIAFQFPLTLKKGVLVPWLPWKMETSRLRSEEAKERFGLDPRQNVMLVFGGSQGASFLNKTAPSAIAKLKESFQAIHLAGPTDVEQVREAYEKLKIRAVVKPFEKEMAQAYAAADLALCRSGAGTVAELIRYGLPALLIPYPYASENHQRKNGEYLRDELGGARLLDQARADPDRLVEELNRLIIEREEKKLRLQKAFAEDRQRIHLAEIVRKMCLE